MSTLLAGLYIHVPFCPKKCGYCNFYSVTTLNLIPDYLTALCTEMDLCARAYDFGQFNTIYLGGGSPSVLSAEQIGAILHHARRTFDLAADSEFTIEVNPGDIDLSYLQSLRGLGINRINIGIQSFDDRILKFLGRRHTGRDAREAIQNAEKAGFANIGLDLIYAVPGQNMSFWMDTLHAALAFEPAHLSCYQLTVEPDTPLGRRLAASEFVLPDNDAQCDFFMKTSETLEGSGYLHYEVSNFAKDIGRMSRHNRKYWDHTPYLGLGPAANSFLDDRRWWNHPSVGKYVRDLKDRQSPVESSEVLTPEQLQLETLMLGLRTKKGVDLARYEKRFGIDLLTAKADIINRLIEEKLVKIEDGSLRPTRSGLAVADSLALI